MRDRLGGEAVATVLLQSSPYFSSSALYPVVQHLGRTAGLAATDSLEVRAYKVEQRADMLSARSLGCLLRLMGLHDGGRTAPRGSSPQEEKTHTLEALMDLLYHLSGQQPVLLPVEDARWIDPTTEELIAQIAQHARETRLMLLVTGHPDYLPSWGNAALELTAFRRLLRAEVFNFDVRPEAGQF